MNGQKKNIGLLLAVIMLLQFILPAAALAEDIPVPAGELTQPAYFVVHEPAFATSTDYQGLGGNSSVEVKSGTTVINPVYNSSTGNYEYNNVPDGASVTIVYTLHLNDSAEASSTDLYTYTDENYFYLAMPEGFALSKIQNAAIGSSFTLTAYDGGTPWTFGTGVIVGSEDPSREGQLKITLSNEGQDKYSKWVSLKVEGTFDSLASGAPVQTELELGTQTLAFNRELPSLDNVTFVKDFVSYDAATNTASWKITLTPPAGNSALRFDGASLVDTLSSNQTYVADSFQVNGRDPATGTFSAGGNTLTYTFPAGASGTHVFTYQTNPTSFGGEQGTTSGNNSVKFNNTANLMQDGNPTPIKTDNAELTANWIEKSVGNYIARDAYGNGVFKWTVTVSVPGGGTATGTSITDAIPAGLALDENHPVEIKINGGVAQTVTSSATAAGQYTYDSDTRAFAYNFPASAVLTGSNTTLTYYTKVVDPNDNINTNEEKTYTNKASFDWVQNPNHADMPSDTAGAVVPTDGLVKKTPDDGSASSNYVYNAAGTFIQWTIRVNDNRILLNNASVSDTILAGQVLVIDEAHPFVVTKAGSSSETVTIIDTAGTKQGGGATDTNFNYSSTGSPAVETFGYAFGTVPATDYYTITYYTKLTESSIDQNFYVNGTVSYTNGVTLTANGTTYNDGATKRFSSQMIDKANATSYDYNTKTAKWKITINRNRLELNNAVLTDTLPTVTVGGQQQIAMTLLVDAGHPFTVTPQNGGRTIAPGEITAVNGAAGFSVAFSEAIYDTYVVEFYTMLTDYSLRGNQSDAVFTNSATIDADEVTSVTGITDTGTVTVKNPVLTKDYAVDEDLIHWKSYINLGKLVLNEAQVSDTLTESAYVPGSARLYRLPNATLGTDGKLLTEGERTEVLLTSGETVTADTGDLTYSGNLLTVKLPNGGNSIYVLEFDTALPDKDINNYTNTIVLTGATSTASNGSNTTPVTVSNYWSIGAGGATSYTLVKTSEPNGGGVPVQGATYRLVNAAGTPIRKNNSVIEVTTDENGVAVFSNLPTRAFYALEVQAPDGYDINLSPVALAANDTAITHDDPLETGLATLYVDKASSVTGTLLSGGSFGLYIVSGGTPAQAPWKTASSENGRIIFTEVPVGSYVIKEIAAPNGYSLTADTVLVTVGYQNGSVTKQYEWPQYARGYDEATLENDPVPPTGGTTVTINKVSKFGALPLSGGTFVLSGMAGEVPFEQAASAQSGKVSFTGVPVGEYTIREQSAPGGYLLTDKAIRLTVSYDAEQTGYAVAFADYEPGVTPALENQPVPVSAMVRIYKMDAATAKPLAGAEFTLYDASGRALRTVVSGTNGYAWFQGLANGSYTIKETKAPFGYTVSPVKFNVTAVTGGYTEFTVSNIAQSSLAPATGGENGVLGFSLMGCALALGALYAARNKKRRENT